MYSLTTNDAKKLKELIASDNDELNTAVENYGNETHFVGLIEGMAFMAVDIAGVVIAYKAATKLSDKLRVWCAKAIAEFIAKAE